MTTMITAVPVGVDLAAVKARQQAAWATGDYGVVGTTLVIVAEELCEAVDLRAGQRVLDVATGNGITALAAARRWCEVTAADYVPALVEQGRVRAAAERLAVTFEEADAENLPYRAGAFDVVLSTFGVMFTADQERAARELLRVCRPGGRIGMANWTPTGFIGEMFRVIGRYLPPAPGVLPPSLWGTEERLHALFGTDVTALQVVPRHYSFRYRSVEHWLDVFRTTYGPMIKAFAALDGEGQRELEADLRALAARYDRGDSAGMVVPSEYLRVVATRR